MRVKKNNNDASFIFDSLKGVYIYDVVPYLCFLGCIFLPRSFFFQGGKRFYYQSQARNFWHDKHWLLFSLVTKKNYLFFLHPGQKKTTPTNNKFQKQIYRFQSWYEAIFGLFDLLFTQKTIHNSTVKNYFIEKYWAGPWL